MVTAAVPMRMPLVTAGGRGSSGTAFLFTVMPALWSASSASSPERSRPLEVHQHEVVVGAAGHELVAAADQLGREGLRVRHHLPLRRS